MDGTAGYTASLASASKDLGRVVNRTIVSDLALESPDVSKLYFSKGSKRRYNVDRPINLNDGSSLVFGLDCSSSSCTTICLGKEMEDEPPIDLGLCINPNVGEKRPSYRKSTLDAVKMRRPVLDLQLSLSTGPTESDVTSVSQGFIPCHKYSESPALTPTVEKGDEGSTSSRWKTGPLVPPLQNVVISYPSNQNHIYSNLPLTSNISSIEVEKPSLVCPIKQQQQRKTSVKRCRSERCTKGARGVSGLCISHGGGQRCQRDGCQKGAEGKTIFCKFHGGGRRCQYLGCTKSAEGRTDYCIGHGGGRRCSHEGCPRAARGKSGLCIRHGGGKRCRIENCNKSAEGITGLCISHGGGRRCHYPECTKGAQGSTMFCKSHGGGRRCTFLGCIKGAEGSSSFCKRHGGGKRCTSEGCSKSVHGGTLFCVSHGGGKRCTMPECTKSARGRTDYCVRHGGGKRCKFEECTKSAQGSTDFCKRHGGGRQCSWGHLGLDFGGLGAITCDKFARGKSGLCAAHNALVQEEQNHESSQAVTTTQELESGISAQMNGIVASGGSFPYPGVPNKDCETTSVGLIGNGSGSRSLPVSSQENFIIGSSCVDTCFSLPEGRVHGGRLMAMLSGGAVYGTSNHSPLSK